MAIGIRCKNPDCGKTCRVKDEYAGKSVKCPGCGQRIAVPNQESALSLDEPVEPSHHAAPRIQEPERLASRPVWPWLAGMTAMMLAGAGGGYFLAASQVQKSEDRTTQAGADDTELRKVRAELEAARAELAKTSPAGSSSQTGSDREDVQRDFELIQGVWKAIDENTFPFSLTITIASLPKDLDLGPKIKGAKFAIGGSRPYEYKIDPTRIPKTIDLTEGEKTLQGIYELKGKGDLLSIAVHLDGKSRPTDYTPGDTSKKWALILRRGSR